DDPSYPDVHPEEGREVGQQGRAVHRLLLRVLLLVPGELSSVHQQERLRPDCHLLYELLHLGEKRLLPDR
ncbi:unnamed protein product, partial [Ectocarpus fasciculatus]